MLPLTRQSIRNLALRYQEGGLERALYDKQQPGADTLLTAKQRQRTIAMACSDPPQGAPVGPCGWRRRKPSSDI